MLSKLDENNVYFLKTSSIGGVAEAVMIYLSNKHTGARNSDGQLLDNLQSEGWFLFRGILNKMKPVKKLSEKEALKLVNEKGRY
jgi:hypothetical protein